MAKTNAANRARETSEERK
jgi:hypothetical protein